MKGLASEGFLLVGARLDDLGDDPRAALVYQRRRHFLFIWPSAHDARATNRALMRQGYNLLHRTQSGMTYWAISDLSPSELEMLARRVQNP